MFCFCIKENQLEDYKKKLIEYNHHQDIKSQLDMKTEQCESQAKSIQIYEEKLKRYKNELSELQDTRSKCESQQSKIEFLEKSNAKHQSKITKLEKDMRAFERLDEQFATLKQNYQESKTDCLKLTDEKMAIQVRFTFLELEHRTLKQQYKEEVDELSGQNANKANEINLLNAHLLNLKEEFKQQVCIHLVLI